MLRKTGKAAWISINFIRAQFLKTIRRPGRLVAIPMNLLRRLLVRAAAMLSFNLKRGGIFTDSATKLVAALASVDTEVHRHFEAGNALLDQGRPLEAMEHYEWCLKHTKEPLIFYIASACLLVGLGRSDDSLLLLKRANELRWDGVSPQFKKWRVLEGDFWATVFGHSALIDYVIKLGILEGRQPHDTILYLPAHLRLANGFLVDQWRPHMKVAEKPEDLPFSPAIVPKIRFDYAGPLLEDGNTSHLWEAAAKTYMRWYGEGRGPLLKLSDEVRDKGRAVLAKAGIPPDAWFVNLHMREIGSKQYHVQLHNVLNTNINAYFPAIEEVTRRGGWIVRLGDPSMTPMPPMPNVWDYCHSDVRSDWMDIFLCAEGRFLLGSSSGPAYVPPLYGVPSVLTNWWPPAQRPWHPQDLFLPKLYRMRNSGELLSLARSLSEPFGYCNAVDYLSSNFDVAVENNEPDYILSAVVEMFERLEGTVHYTSDDLELRARADRIYEAHRAYGMGILARDFLKAYRAILD